MEIKNITVVVTGGASGLGEAAMRRLVKVTQRQGIVTLPRYDEVV